MTSEGNVADTGILEEARQLMNQEGITMCEALESMMKKARKQNDTDKIQRIKPTQKAEDCRKCRNQKKTRKKRSQPNIS
ncbi:MAG: polymorphic toxin type 34 domain-containing protein [Planktothrix sp.]